MLSVEPDAGAKVGELDVTGVRDENVLRFDVAVEINTTSQILCGVPNGPTVHYPILPMHILHLMQRLHGQHRLSDVELGGLFLEHEPLATVLDTVQIAAGGVLHHQVEVFRILEGGV
ncbi:hypothetical protein BC937DRAFT_89262 [Endogone sp. FLAS-F59071]|nr:hypothetical protein BC937DRAFT_89262 [Endogone sp. FLAS-F59071]|eukprot:RUS17992.1 hypothetical protein BC937DRAFT_89262 [Endogone sp. FLAS-F59071]